MNVYVLASTFVTCFGCWGKTDVSLQEIGIVIPAHRQPAFVRSASSRTRLKDEGLDVILLSYICGVLIPKRSMSKRISPTGDKRYK